jgi:hypothetical protein
MNHITPANSPHGSTVECWSDNADAEIKKGQTFEVIAWNVSRIQISVNGGLKWVKAQFFKVPMTEKQKEDEKREVEKRFHYFQNGGDNGPTGHGDDCLSDADPGM